jgi:hypothetical protein
MLIFDNRLDIVGDIREERKNVTVNVRKRKERATMIVGCVNNSN